MYILLFNLIEQLKMMLQNVDEVNRMRLPLSAIVRDSTRKNGLITKIDKYKTILGRQER